MHVAEGLLEKYVPIVAGPKDPERGPIYVRVVEAHQIERMAEVRAEVQALIAAVKA